MSRLLLKSLLWLVLVGQISWVRSQEEPLVFHLMGQDDDMSSLANTQGKSLYEELKWINLGAQSSLSFGGGYRFQVESYLNENFDVNGVQDNIWFLNRIMLHAHVKVRNNWEFYMELNSSTVEGKRDVSPVDKDVLAMNQAFVRYRITPQWGLTVGRENLKLGGRRLVDIREGPNVRRSFDLVKLEFKDKEWDLSSFFALPVKPEHGIFDNDYLHFGETFSGFYLTRSREVGLNYDLYGFYQKDDAVTYNVGRANERRATVGSRVFGQWGKFTLNNELAYQFGSFGTLDISAYTVSINGEYQGRLLGIDAVYGFKSEVISGDKNLEDGRLNTFDALYPRGAYFGRVAKFGPSNLIDVHPYLNLRMAQHYLEMDYDIFWRYSNADGVYDAALQLAYPSLNQRSLIGNQIGLLYGWDVNNHFNLELETNLIVPGQFLIQSGLSDTLFHVVLTTEFRF